MSIYAQYAALLDGVLDELEAEGALPAGLERRAVAVEPPRDASHGDLATNAAMVLAKAAGTNPRALAALIAPKLEALPPVTSVAIAGPGFINLKLKPEAWRDELRTILIQGDGYGMSDIGQGSRVNVEYVSANPTGPLHMGHCRGAVVGDSLARLLEAAGFRVTKEYYVNDAGAQVDTLARSVHLRYREALGETIAIPEGMYPGDYLVPVGVLLAAEYGDQYAAAPETDWLPLFRARTIAAMLDLIRHDLALLGIHHDKFASEAELQASGAVDRALDTMRGKGLVYQGELERPKSLDPHDEWEPVELTLFRSTQFGDDQDRPIKKADGSWTYFGSDAAYHLTKADSADHLVNIWGADHAGTVKRVQAAVSALTDNRVDLDVKVIQMVRLFRAGEPVKMSKRSGDFITLAEVVQEVGKDVVRFMMLTKRADTPLDFDFAKVVEASKDNPVFYVQYAHARVSSLKRKAADAGIDLAAAADLSLLDDEELGLVRFAAQYSRVIEAAALAHEPHRIAFFLYELAAQFHALWNRGNDDPARRFLIENQKDVSRARLELALGIGQVIRSGLALMGVEAAEEMR
ncbi:MAG: arginine--tRNA ligase [Sphingomicrobium sp.]